MKDEVRAALAIDASSAIEDRTIDITTTGRRSGKPRRIEIVFYRLGEDVYLSGIPAPKARDWLANLAANPRFTLHLKHGVATDLPATATVILEPAERRRVLGCLSKSSTAAGVRVMTDGRKPIWTSGWRRVRWPK
jgi:deazaflavin-dependent oxidoreductase (nitroreductase family)